MSDFHIYGIPRDVAVPEPIIKGVYLGVILMDERFDARDVIKIIWMGFKVAVVIYAVFQDSNLTILYQGF